MSRVTFELPGPVVPWARTSGRGGRRFKAPEQKHYQQRLALTGRAAAPSDWPTGERYGLHVIARCTPKRRCDASNVLKQAEDALEGVLWANDRRIDDTRCTRRFDATPGTEGLTVIAWVLGEEQ